jgi:hypothetical protein
MLPMNEINYLLLFLSINSEEIYVVKQHMSYMLISTISDLVCCGHAGACTFGTEMSLPQSLQDQVPSLLNWDFKKCNELKIITVKNTGHHNKISR